MTLELSVPWEQRSFATVRLAGISIFDAEEELVAPGAKLTLKLVLQRLFPWGRVMFSELKSSSAV